MPCRHASRASRACWRWPERRSARSWAASCSRGWEGERRSSPSPAGRSPSLWSRALAAASETGPKEGDGGPRPAAGRLHASRGMIAVSPRLEEYERHRQGTCGALASARRSCQPTMHCASCGTDNRSSAKFCHGCGAPLGLACPTCGAPYAAGHLFCDQCGGRLDASPESPAEVTQTPEPPTAERRLVSVLFADLVGFTSASEARDAEETRELLSAYFDTCRQLIERYGGMVEKFIGDAVMAVWGTPLAQEDDAERAVRAALDLVAAVPELDPSLRARAGVLTGEAAVTLGAAGQGMV